ncbi:hypothetical protein TSACC_21712 [Terrimicrobium sacchariphilum]|uniref:Large polyvalent protein associated domain-containing protein n=1 Tax=Terrimicrobium sacchariphilum TaxID=690879 RepID=A0A146G6B6_TERSA|nr:hypothetical protein [Terrimicrobium sacchariphilum]GAT33299.1 hypothetical protein TSACC_21712 [Terrimicrobium sacchariphilum]
MTNLLQPTTAATIDDATATRYYNEFDSITDPALKQQRTAELQSWIASKQQDAQDSVDTHFEKVFTDDRYFEQLAQNPQMREAASLSVAPDLLKYESANRAYFNYIRGRDLTDEEYQIDRSAYLKNRFDKTHAGDGELYRMIRGEYEIGKSLNTDIPKAIVGAMATGKPISIPAIVDEWKAGKTIPGPQQDAIMQQANRTAAQVYFASQKFGPEIQDAYGVLKSYTEGGKGLEDITALAERLQSKSLEERKALYGFLALGADANGIDRGAFEQVAKNIGDSLSRSVDFLPKGALNAQQREVLFAIDAAENGRMLIREEDGKPVMQAGSIYEGAPGYRKPTADETAQFIDKYRKVLPVIQIARELRSVAKDGIDPIKPILREGSLLGTAERGMYGLAGSAGTMAATAVPGVGMVLSSLALADEELDRIQLQYPNVDFNTAQSMALVSGTAQMSLEKLQLESLAGRLPMVGALFKNMQAGFQKAALGVAASAGEQNVQEGLQDMVPVLVDNITAAVRQDMPEANWKDDLGEWANQRPETFFAVLPLALVGGGLANFRDFKDGGRFMLTPDMLKYGGFSQSQRDRILAATTQDEAQAVYREEYGKRTPENISAGVQALQADQKAAQEAQNDATRPTMETFTKPDGSRVWRITEPESGQTTEFGDQDSADQAYVDAARRAEQVRMVADQQAAQSDQAILESGRKANPWGAIDSTPDQGLTMTPEKLFNFTPIPDEQLPASTQKALSALNQSQQNRGAKTSAVRFVAQSYGGNLDNAKQAGKSAEFIKQFENLTGKQVVFVDSNQETPTFAGAMNKANPNTIFIHVRGNRDVHALIGHEWGHTVEQQNPELYREMQRALLGYVNDPKSRAKALKSSTYTDPKVMTVELANNIIGDAFLDPQFWDYVHAAEPTLFEKLVASVRAWFKAAIEKISNSEWGTREFISDIEGMQRTLAEYFKRATENGRQSELPMSPDSELSLSTPRPVNREAETQAALEAQMKSPDGRIRMFERARDRMMTLQQQNRVAIEGMRWGTASQDKVARQQLIRSIGELDALLSVFPPEIRGKVGGYAVLSKIGNGETALADFFTKRIEMIGTELERSLKREYGSKMAKLMERSKPAKNQSGQKREGTAGADLHALFDTLRDAMDWTTDRAEAHVTALEAQIAKGEMTPEEEAHAQMEIGLVPLVASWKQADAERRAAAVASATEIWDRGYRAFKEQKIQERERRQAIRQQLITDTGKAGTAPERDAKALENNSLKGRWKDSLLGLLNFEQVSKWVFGDKSIEAQRLADMEREASHAKEDSITEKTVALEDLFTKLAGDRFKGESLRWQMAQKSMTVPLSNGKESLHMSQLEAITATLLWRQEDGRRHMIGLLDDSGKPVSAWHYNQDFIDNIEKQLTPEAREVRAFLSEQYASEYARLNPVYRELNGINLPKNANYSPITVVPQQAQSGQTIDPVTGNTMSTASTTPGSLRTRSGRVAEPDFRDALQVYISHTKQMEHWIAYAKFVNEATALLNNRDVGNSVQAASGEQAVKVLRGWLDYFGKGGTRDAGAFLALNQGLGRIMNRAASVALVGRIGTIAVQSTQLAAGLAEMPTGSYLSRLGKLFTGQLGWGTAFQSDYIQRRLQEMPPVVRQAVEGIRAEKPNRLRYAVSKLGQLIGGTDALMTAGTYAIVHDYQLKRAHESGLTGADAERAAREAAERSVDRLAQPTRAGARSLFENTATNPAVRLAWAFASDARKNFGLMAYALANRPAAEAARVITAVWIANSVMAALIRSAWADARNDDDEEIFDAKNWSPKTLALKAATDPLAGIPFLGDKAQGMVLRAFGVWTPDGDILSSIDRAAVSVNRIDDYLSGDFEAKDVFRDVDTILSGMGLLNSNIAAAASLAHLSSDLFNVTKNATGE